MLPSIANVLRVAWKAALRRGEGNFCAVVFQISTLLSWRSTRVFIARLIRRYSGTANILEKTNRRLVSPSCKRANSHVLTPIAHVLTSKCFRFGISDVTKFCLWYRRSPRGVAVAQLKIQRWSGREIRVETQKNIFLCLFFFCRSQLLILLA